MDLEGLVNRHTLEHVLLHLIVRRRNSGQQFEHISDLILWDDDYSIDWIAKGQVPW